MRLRPAHRLDHAGVSHALAPCREQRDTWHWHFRCAARHPLLYTRARRNR